MPHHDTHGFYSFELQSDFARIKENLIALEPGIDFDDWLPLRAEPEVETSPPTKVMERYLGKFVESAVQHVGWVPRGIQVDQDSLNRSVRCKNVYSSVGKFAKVTA